MRLLEIFAGKVFEPHLHDYKRIREIRRIFHVVFNSFLQDTNYVSPLTRPLSQEQTGISPSTRTTVLSFSEVQEASPWDW